jgi:hypothetical protein
MTQILSILIFVQLAVHQSRIESLSDSRNVQSVAEFTVRKIFISSANKKYVMVKVNQPLYRPGVAQRVPGI